MTSAVKGTIFFKDGGIKQNAIPFRLLVNNSRPENNLMFKFKKFKFTEAEKRNLSYRHRKQINLFQGLEIDSVKEQVNNLIYKITKAKTSTITIDAADLGAYICMAAIFSGKIPKHIAVQFNLSALPISLFPKKLVKTKSAPDHVNINLKIEKNCWFKDIKSLYECPEYLKIQNLPEVFANAA